MKKNLKKVYKWLVVSSANPKEVSATIKGVLILALPQVLILAQSFGLQIENNVAMGILERSVTILGAVLAIFGLIRKVYNTAK